MPPIWSSSAPTYLSGTIRVLSPLRRERGEEDEVHRPAIFLVLRIVEGENQKLIDQI